MFFWDLRVIKILPNRNYDLFCIIQEQLLRVQLATGAGNPSVSLLQQCVTLVQSSTSRLTRFGLLQLLCTWLSHCPVAVAHLLNLPTVVPYLLTNVSNNYCLRRSSCSIDKFYHHYLCLYVPYFLFRWAQLITTNLKLFVKDSVLSSSVYVVNLMMDLSPVSQEKPYHSWLQIVLVLKTLVTK